MQTTKTKLNNVQIPIKTKDSQLGISLCSNTNVKNYLFLYLNTTNKTARNINVPIKRIAFRINKSSGLIELFVDVDSKFPKETRENKFKPEIRNNFFILQVYKLNLLIKSSRREEDKGTVLPLLSFISPVLPL